jgi:pimeloyl-ACP methyl ester carboxylesterase
VARITLYDAPLDIHYFSPRHVAADKPLLLYATGDGGWRGKDKEVFHQMTLWGYPVAGFSAPSYLKHLGFQSDTTTPRRLARDYDRLIVFARKIMKLPDDQATVLVGVSRGAGLAVVAAGQGELQIQLAGVLAIGLTKEEEYVRRYRRRPGVSPTDMPSRERVMVETYQSLPRLLTLPVSVVQSTHDNYLPAAQARPLFGPDTEFRQLHPIEARDHSFSDAREALYAQMRQSLEWICGFLPGHAK